jgi:integrase
VKVTRKLQPTLLNALEPGLHSDGGNLYFQVSLSKVTDGRTRRSWIYRYRWQGRTRDMGLGSFPKISLKSARELAEAQSVKLQAGEDPIECRRAAKGQKRDADDRTRMTLKHCVGVYLRMKRSTWSKTQKDKWEGVFRENVYPKYGTLHINAIDDGTVRRILEPIWDTKTTAAKQLRRKLETVLAWAQYMKYRPPGANPAAWANALELHFGDGKRAGNRPSLPYQQMPAFMKGLVQDKSLPACALRFLILTAARSDDVLKARWSQVDLSEKVLTIPGRGTDKMRKDLPIPLSDAAVAVLKDMKKIKVSDYLFPGVQDNKPLNNGALRELLLDRPDITAHGMRATFRSWADDETDYDHDIKEMALGHKVKNDTEGAYRRTTMYKKRVALMADWGNYCSGSSISTK